MEHVFPSAHPLVHHLLATLRARETGTAEFRRCVRSLGGLLLQEATADLSTKETRVETPLGASSCQTLNERIMIVPILRAGLGMVDGILDVLPDAEVWHVGLFRNELTLRPTEYYNKIPPQCQATLALVVDPMLATGGSAVHACRILKQAGVRRMKMISLIAAPEGIACLTRAMPDVPIHVGAVDERLTEIGFIYPGLGDAGDRQFGTGMGHDAPASPSFRTP